MTIRLTDDLLQPRGKKPKRSLWADIFDLVWPLKPVVLDVPPPDLTLLFQAQARNARIPEPTIQATVGYYRAIAPELGMEQLHQLALVLLAEYQEGVVVGEGGKRNQ